MPQSDKPVKELREAVYDYAGETSNQEAATILREEASCLEQLWELGKIFSFPPVARFDREQRDCWIRE
jgi:hypothetical protein